MAVTNLISSQLWTLTSLKWHKKKADILERWQRFRKNPNHRSLKHSEVINIDSRHTIEIEWLDAHLFLCDRHRVSPSGCLVLSSMKTLKNVWNKQSFHRRQHKQNRYGQCNTTIPMNTLSSCNSVEGWYNSNYILWSNSYSAIRSIQHKEV